MKNEECTCDVRSVPYAVLELEDRKHKRLWVVILVLIVALLGTNVYWINRDNQFEDAVTTQTITQDSGDGGNNTYSGDFIGGDYYGETDDYNNR